MDKYFDIVQKVNKSSTPACVHRNANANVAFVTSFFLRKLIEQYDQELNRLEQATPVGQDIARESTIVISLQLNTTNLNIMCHRLIGMFKSAFLDDENRSANNEIDSTNKSNGNRLSLRTFDLSASYTRNQLLGLFNYESDKRNLFTFIFGLFRTVFAKTNLLIVRKSSFRTSGEVNVLNLDLADELAAAAAAIATPANNKPLSEIEIRNIDDSGSDTETAGKSTDKKAATAEQPDSDDCLLIGSWFDEPSITNRSRKESESTLNKLDTGDASSLVVSTGAVFELDVSASNKNSFLNVILISLKNKPHKF